MSKVKIENVGLQKKDERLEYLLSLVKEGAQIFIDAVKNSPDEHESVGFKAFTLKSEKKEEADAIFDIVITAMAVELNEHVPELVKAYTFYHKVEEVVGEEFGDLPDGEKGYSLILLCDKKEPPTKEEVEKIIAEKKKQKEQQEEEEEEKKENED
jgi:hypothetical protein